MAPRYAQFVVALIVVCGGAWAIISVARSPRLLASLSTRVSDPLFVSGVLLLCFCADLTSVLDPVALPFEVLLIASMGPGGAAMIAMLHLTSSFRRVVSRAQHHGACGQ